MSGQRSRQGTRTAGLKARTQLSQMSASREQRLREEGRYQAGSTFARAEPGRAARCGKVRYRDELAAKLALAKLERQDKEGHAERRAYECPRCNGWHLTSWKMGAPARTSNPSAAGSSPGVRPKTRRETGFSRSVKLAVRKRAGMGDIDAAACEACNRWLGRHGGEIQHIQARGAGGSALRNTITNAVLLCGPAADKKSCHGLCEARDQRMRAMGFWLKQSDEPQPLMLHGEQGGALVRLTPDGGYEPARPGEAVA